MNLGSHRTVGHIARQLAAEYDDLEIIDAFVGADNGHRNFYDNEMSPPEIEGILTVIGNVLPVLEQALQERPRNFTIANVDQRWRVRTLTGQQTLEVGDSSPVGFSNTHAAPANGSGDA